MLTTFRSARSVSTLVCLVTAIAAISTPALSQDTSGSTNQGAPARAFERLFLGFITEANIVERQWWEGRVDFADADVIEGTVVRGVAAFQPWDNLEVGGTIGFGGTSTRAPLPEGSGGTDFDLWAKYRLGIDSRETTYMVGGIVTVPTGDDTAGLGEDAFGLAVFASLRYRLKRLSFDAHLGARFNGSGETLGVSLGDGKVSPLLGFAVIAPMGKKLNLVGELDYEGERFDNSDEDFRFLAGVNWRVSRSGVVRGGIGFGLSDGAPDFQAVVGYASQF